MVSKSIQAIISSSALIIGLASFRFLASRLHNTDEIELLVLGIAAFSIILSSNIAYAIGVNAAVIELIAGILIAYAGGFITEPLAILSSIGANILLFMAGTEVDVRLLRQKFSESIILGVIGFSVPGILGYIVSLLYGLSLEGALLVIAGFSATSVALTYSILRSMGMLTSRSGQIVLAAAMVADVIGMLLINIASASIDPKLLMYVLLLVGALIVQPLVPRLSGAPFEAELRLVSMAIIILGVLSEIIGVHSVLTSFILGVIVSETVRNRKVLKEKLEGLATGFFTPFFFVASGMNVNPNLLAEGIILIVGVGSTISVAKLLPALAYFRVLKGLRRRASIVLSASLTPLLTVSILSGDVGLRLGLISQEIYNIIMGAVLISVIVATAITYRYSRR